MGKAAVLVVALSALFTLPGCNGRDTEGLTRIGRKVIDRAQGVSTTVREKIDWGGLRSGGTPVGGIPSGIAPGGTAPGETALGGNTLQDKVAARLRWDKNLQGVQIDILVSDNNIELKGFVKNQDMRFRAVELAETTSGVERVTDSLTIAEP